jgi:pimeloyl-ACP methyl ester carboxylesterase
MLLALSSAVYAGTTLPKGSRPVSWTTTDGVKIAGFYHSAKEGHKVWVLLHGLGSNKQEWIDFVNALTPQGDGFLIYDARGHGESVLRTDKSTVDYRQFNTAGPGSQWDRMADDLGRGILYLKKRYGIFPETVAVGGASLGANVALRYASSHPEVPALFLLSPGLVYAGVDSPGAFQRYGQRPLFIAASPGDVYAHGSVRQLIARRDDKNMTVVWGEGAAHGVQMFNDTFTRKLLAWINGIDASR